MKQQRLAACAALGLIYGCSAAVPPGGVRTEPSGYASYEFVPGDLTCDSPDTLRCQSTSLQSSIVIDLSGPVIRNAPAGTVLRMSGRDIFVESWQSSSGTGAYAGGQSNSGDLTLTIITSGDAPRFRLDGSFTAAHQTPAVQVMFNGVEAHF